MIDEKISSNSKKENFNFCYQSFGGRHLIKYRREFYTIE